MKATLSIILTFITPLLAFSQTDNGFSVGAIFGLLLLIGLFFVLRSLILWYWKVDKVLQNQELTNEYLSQIRDELRKGNEVSRSQNPSVSAKKDDSSRWDFAK